MSASSMFPAIAFSLAILCSAASKLQGESPAESPVSILSVTVSEYHVELDPSPEATPDSVLKELLSGDWEPSRTIRLSTCNSAQTHLLITGDVNSNSITSGERGKTDTRTSPPKLIVDFRAERQSSGAVMDLDYHASGFVNNSAGVSTGESRVVQTTNFYELGKPKLIAGLSGEDEFYLVVTVTEPGADARED
ncbi:hypothetical protein FYK55_23600 [Roseiconus nitratireducens]|uniref:Uncharacterized protein n=1 Tax=Roseiconus nitratireducens TaxID=2605748 RepID=A0A5M6CWT6_9BACT|nr:hypothetical protein [Roseiconus nitratireducens]KAA5539563.1 hypothetical protein FYK55_23600 [Roseiconus nitratireducens]